MKKPHHPNCNCYPCYLRAEEQRRIDDEIADDMHEATKNDPRPPPSPESELVAQLQTDIKAAAALARPSDPKELSAYFAHIGGLRKQLRDATDALIARNAQYV